MKQSRFIGLMSSQDWGTVSVGFGEMYFDLICSFLFFFILILTYVLFSLCRSLTTELLTQFCSLRPSP